MRFRPRPSERHTDRPVEAPDAEPADVGRGEGRSAGIVRMGGVLHHVAAQIGRAGGQAPALRDVSIPLAVLWSRIHSYDAADPGWPDRDRFVLSDPAATPLLYALLHLTGHAGMEQATLDHYGEVDAVAAAAAAYGRHPAIEASALPGGQAIGAAVGMALAERVLAARFGKSLVDHRVWAVCDAAELGHGVAHEVVAVAGLLRLDRLVLLADATEPAAEDARPWFTAAGWAVKSAEAEDASDVEAALSFAERSRKPTLVWCLPGGRALAARLLPARPVSDRVNAATLEAWRAAGSRGSSGRRSWLKRMARHPQRGEFERVLAGRLPDECKDRLAALRQGLKSAAAPGTAMQLIDRLEGCAPELLHAHAGTGPAADAIQPGQYAGRHVGFGHRPHGMAACLNGLALHGGAVPVGRLGLADCAGLLPALQHAAGLRRRILHVMTEGAGSPDAAFLGPLLAAWRAMPELHLFRPGSPLEAVECLELALQRADGPALIILADPDAASDADGAGRLSSESGEARCARGGYVLAEADGPRQATLIAAGAELAVALAARASLALAGIAATVVSLPCWMLFAHQDQGYRDAVLGTALRVGLDPACASGWDLWLACGGLLIGGGAAGLPRQMAALTGDAVAQAVRRRLAEAG